MTIHRVRRLIHLHENATRHSNEYKRLSKDPSAQRESLRHLKISERLFSQVSYLIRSGNVLRQLTCLNLVDS
jgi:hypothetical protein